MADRSSQEQRELLTLTEVSKRTGISMPTLQKYKKQYQDRIPSEGKGRSQRYPVEALPVFEEIKKENVSRRGRPRKEESAKKSRRARGGKKRSTRKTASGGGRRGGRAAAGDDKELLPLTEVARRAGVSYATATKYAKEHQDRFPSVGSGRKRRYEPGAVDVVKKIYGSSKGGRRGGGKKKKGSTKTRRRGAARQAGSGDMKKVTSTLERIEKRLERLEKEIKKPLRRV